MFLADYILFDRGWFAMLNKSFRYCKTAPCAYSYFAICYYKRIVISIYIFNDVHHVFNWKNNYITHARNMKIFYGKQMNMT